jgi:hypothetical protein
VRRGSAGWPVRDVKPVVAAAVRYARRHPEELLRAVRGVVGLRLGVHLDVVRWLLHRAEEDGARRDVVLEAVPPGLRFGATLELMGNVVRASGLVYVEHVEFGSEQWRVELRFEELALKLIEEAPDSPLATLVKSGALDLSRPGNLAASMPKRPPMLVDAADDRIVLDLRKHPKLGGRRSTERLLVVLSAVLGIKSIATDDAHLDLALRAFRRSARACRATTRAAAPC